MLSSRRRRGERGAAAVEFALVLPLLLVLLFGIIAYGVVFAQSLSLSNAARQAARAAVIDGTTCDQVSTLAKDNADTIAMDGADATVTIRRGATEAGATDACGGGGQPCAGQAAGTNVYVVLTYATVKSGLSLPFVPVPATLTATGAFRCEL
jgi:Flp pilus assembly protein TadG